MKILNPEEAKELLKKPIIDDILGLQLNESCLVEKQEWKYKSSLQSIILNHSYRNGMGFKVKKLPSGKGWVVTRVS